LPKKILAIDDDKNILNLEKAILEQQGFVVTTAACERVLATVDDDAEDRARDEFPAVVWAGIVSGLRQPGSGGCGHQRPRRIC
jgi:DNA-binding response OmpR family regulator